jgi:hypothetical protein
MPEVYTDITTEMYKETSKKCAEIMTENAAQNSIRCTYSEHVQHFDCGKKRNNTCLTSVRQSEHDCHTACAHSAICPVRTYWNTDD